MNAQPEREAERDFEQAAQLLGSRRVYPRSAKSLDRTVAQVISKRGLASEKFNQAIEKCWQQATQGRWPGKTRTGSLQRGRLEIIVSDSVTNQEIMFARTQLLNQLKTQLPDFKITALNVRVGKINNNHPTEN
jgi:hypothetical protein